MEVRPARSEDLRACMALDHSYTTDRVWQMETREEDGILTVCFRLARLPREMRVEYPCQGEDLLAGWRRCDDFLVAVDEGRVCGYVALAAQPERGLARVSDLVVDRAERRRGVGTALLWAATQWGRERNLLRLMVEVQTKNYPATRFCQSRGLAFCGYSDHYWPSQDIALFFGQSLR